MARHLIIGDGTAYGTTNGLVDAGAVSIQKLSASGPTELGAGETIADSAQIRFLQGTSGRDIVTPWIYGKDVVHFGGKTYSAPVSQISTVTVSANATNTSDVEVTLKFVNTSNGQADPFDAKSFTVVTNASGVNTQAEIGEAFVDEMYAGYNSGGGSVSATQTDELPWFVKSIAWDNTSLLTFVGWDKGETMQNGQVAEYPTTFEIKIENGDAAANGGTYTIATGTTASRGYGYGEYIYEMESELMGTNYGYYNRVQLPVAPSNTASKTTTYDTYQIVATKDGSSNSQIHGVDNLIDITIALPTDASGAASAYGIIFEGKLNPYMNSAGFASVNL